MITALSSVLDSPKTVYELHLPRCELSLADDNMKSEFIVEIEPDTCRLMDTSAEVSLDGLRILAGANQTLVPILELPSGAQISMVTI
jgi:hypothetical protein